MKLPKLSIIRLLILLLYGLATYSASAASPARVDYNRDIRPLLANHCFACHGPDKENRQANLRLDTSTGAYADLGGYQAIVPADPAASVALARIAATDPAERMPPEESDRSKRGPDLTPEQIALIGTWIAQGAQYDRHWSFQSVVRPKLPAMANPQWSNHPIDRFVLHRLAAAGIQPALEANRPVLIRRLSLDLIGLPPTTDQIDQFVVDSSPRAYNLLVDRLLASEHFGERWARHWLDQARYADTHGYTVDSERSMWPYRDWVIRALNTNMPFDQFTIEQLAGDLLPAATQQQRVATGFHRNTLINQEGGVDQEQFRNEAVMDRVNTTGAVWLGLTVGCAQCHHHKFDPISQREYYRLFAFFNSDHDSNSTEPTERIATAEQQQQLAKFDADLRAVRSQIEADVPSARKPAADAEQDKGDSPASGEALSAQLASLTEARKKFRHTLPSTMVLRALPTPRPTHLLIRGDFLRPGESVQPGVPAALPPLKQSTSHATRLDLARWLVSRENPLTARVAVNRLWMHYFGRGLVATENDFGSQGELPTHPELLDWLAAELMEHGWSMKHIHRLIVTSATYRQSSRRRPELTNIDPHNELLARQVRLRVEAEIVRDLGLAVSGLLTDRIGGPSVRPPQPAGIYAFTQRSATWTTSMGADRYRRGMYTFFMRSAPYPLLTTFDSPRFNTTCTRRTRSNTPLQALTMANDQTMQEMTRALALRLLGHSEFDDRQRLWHAMRLCFARGPDPVEQQRLLKFLRQARSEMAQAPEAAQQVAGVEAGMDGDVAENSSRQNSSRVVERASWTLLARVLLNLDEFITRE